MFLAAPKRQHFGHIFNPLSTSNIKENFSHPKIQGMHYLIFYFSETFDEFSIDILQIS